MFSSAAQCLVNSEVGEETDLGAMVYADWRLWDYNFVARLDSTEESTTIVFRGLFYFERLGISDVSQHADQSWRSYRL